MGKTVIEELVISLGLDAKALTESKAVEAINTIRQSVTLLNGELKEAEKSFAALGKIKMGSGTSRASRPKKSSEQDMMGMLGFPRPSAQVKKTDDKPIKVETVPSKEERQERRKKPLRNFRNILDMMPGFASVVYMSKEIFSLAQKIMGMFSESNQAAREMKNVADKSGLNTKTIQTFGLIAQKFGGNMEDTAKDIEGLISGIPIFGKGQLPELLQRVVVPTHAMGKMRPPEDILKDVVAGLTERIQGDKVKGARFANEVGMSYSTIMAMSQGWDKFIEAQRGYVRSGAIISEETMKELNEVANKEKEVQRKIEKAKADFSNDNKDFQLAWYNFKLGFWQSLIKPEKFEAPAPNALGVDAKGQAPLAFDVYRSMKNAQGETERVQRPSDGFRSQGSMPTNAVINIYGTPTNQSKVEMKLNTKTGPFRENLVRVQ